MSGLSHDGGPLVDGWTHVVESVGDVLRTPVGSRVMRPDYGSRLPDMIDANADPASVLALWVSVAEALDQWEPRLALTELSLEPLSAADMASGRIALAMTGTYYPRGHLGDWTTGVAPAQLTVTV